MPEQKGVQSTSGGLIRSASRQSITIYAPDGTPHTCAPVDAREILASGTGYTAEPPAKVEAHEQPSEQQPIHADPVAVESDGPAESAITAEIEPDAASGPKRRNRRTSTTE